ncbi:hypothetical protein OAF34_00860 [Pirellulaceae bacterium]|nr:hypothetical protein [Pirellulaceae bacterium]
MSTLSVEHDIENIPKPIVEKLRSVVRRARIVTITRGCLAILSTAILAMLVGMAIDSSFTIFSVAVRASISIGLLAFVVVSAFYFLLLPLTRSYDLTGIARIIESRHPELKERLSSAVQLLSSKESNDMLGSEALISAVAEQAVGQVGSVSPSKEFSFAAAKTFLIIALVSGCFLGALFAFWPSATTRLFSRVIAPFANIGNVHAQDIVVIPGDIVVAEGGAVRVEITVADQRVSSAKFLRRAATDSGDSNRRETAERMKSLSVDAEGNPRFFLSIPAVTEPFQYRIHVGGAVTRHFKVDVVPRPAVEGFEIAYQYPQYIKRDPFTEKTPVGNIKGPMGSTVTVVAHVNTPLKSAQVALSGLPPVEAEVHTDAEGKSFCRWQIVLSEDFVAGRTWTFQLKDDNGFQNWPSEYTIKSITDKPPIIEIVKPTELRQRMKWTDTLPIQYRVEDDHGINKVELVAIIDGGDEISRKLAASEGTQYFQSITNVSLASLANRRAKKISLMLRVQDGLPFDQQGPQIGISETITIDIDETAETFFEKTAAADYAGIREVLLNVLEDLQDSEKATQDLSSLVKTDDRLPEPALQQIDDSRDSSAAAQTKLDELGEVLPETSFASLTDEVMDLAATDIASIREKAGLIKLNDDADRRANLATEAADHVAVSVERTKKLIQDLDALWEKIQKIAELKNLAAEQNEIAAELSKTDMPETPGLPLDTMQAEILEDILEQLTESPEAINNFIEEKQQEAEDLAAAAQELAEKQEDLAELTAESNDSKLDPEEIREKIAEAIAKQQEEIAKEAAALDEEIEDANRAGEDDQSELESKPNDVSDNIEKGDLTEAEQDAEAAAENFQEAADALANGDDVPETDPEQGDPEQGDPEQGDPKQGDPKQGDPEQGDPKQGDPKQGDPKQGDPKQGDPKQGEPQQGDPKQGDPEQGDPKQGDPKQGDPKQGDPEQGDPKQGDPKQGDPKQGDPKQGDPEQGDPQNGDPEQGDPQLDQELAEKAADLAVRQEEVAEQLEALNDGNLDKALELLQKAVAEDTEEVARQAESVANLVDLLSPNENQNAENAVNELNKAVEESRKAESELGEAQQPADEPAQGEPAQGEPAQGEPAQGEPAQGEPAQGEPAQGEPAQGEPAQGEPAQGEPAQGEPAQGEPAQGEPAQGEPAQGEPAQGEPAQEASAEPSIATENSNKSEAMQSQAEAAEALQEAAQALEELANDLSDLADNAAQAEGDTAIGAPISEATAAALADALEAASDANAALASSESSGEASAANSDTAQPAEASGQQAAEAAAASSQQAADALAEAADAAATDAGVPTDASKAAEAMSGSEPAAGNAPPSPSSSPSSKGPPGKSPGKSPSPGQPGESNQPSQSDQRTDGKKGNEGGTSINELQQDLKEYGISAADWSRLPGKLKNKIRQAETDGVPAEYRAMVKRYFRELARRSSKK